MYGLVTSRFRKLEVSSRPHRSGCLYPCDVVLSYFGGGGSLGTGHGDSADQDFGEPHQFPGGDSDGSGIKSAIQRFLVKHSGHDPDFDPGEAPLVKKIDRLIDRSENFVEDMVRGTYCPPEQGQK